MKWIEASITTTSEGTEHVEAMLLSAGVSGWQAIDIEEMRSFLTDNPHQWDYIDEDIFENYPKNVIIKFYASDNESGIATIEALKSALIELKNTLTDIDPGILGMSLEPADDENWLNSWKEYFKPLEIGRRIVIKPAWEQYVNTDKTVVEINPGHVFGTGQHETTYMCIEALERRIKPGCSMLDLGCGSGILSVTGLMLGAEKCVAVDLDPNAAAAAYQNAELNGITKERLSVYTGDILFDRRLHNRIKAEKYDCVAANIIADVIIPLSALLVEMNCLKPGATLIASGIINDSLEEVLSALRGAGFCIVETKIKNQWACITGRA